MYIPTVPLINLSDLIGIHFNKNDISASGEGTNNKNLFFPRGSYSLQNAATSLARKGKPPHCLFPSYFCEQSLKPLRESGSKIEFYKVNETLSPDWDDIRKRIKYTHFDIVVVVHYFGRLTEMAEAHAFMQESGTVILEDGAHVLSPHQERTYSETIKLFSPHKLLPIPPLSILSIPIKLTMKFNDNYSYEWRKEDWRWLAKRIIQKGIYEMRLPFHMKSSFTDKEIITSINAYSPPGDFFPPKLSIISKSLLNKAILEIKKIEEARRNHYNEIAGTVSSIKNMQLPSCFPRIWISGAPYALPLIVPENVLETVFRKFRESGIPVHTWPDLPPEVLAKREEYIHAINWRQTLLLVPIHQSLRIKDIEFIKEKIKNIAASI